MDHEANRYEVRRLAGITTTSELKASGKSAAQIRALVRRDVLVPVLRGVYADATAAREMLSRKGGDKLLKVAAALVAVGQGAVASDQSAAYLHSIDLLRDQSAVATLICPPGHGWRNRAGIRVRELALPAGHVTAVVGLPVTTAARTVVDLARTLEFRAGVVVADSALHRKLVTKADLRAVLAACPRWRGTRQAAAVVEFADGRAESPLESIARVAFRDFGLPPPELQAWLGSFAGPVGRVDFYWPRYRTIAEADGAAKYSADPNRVPEQLRRDQLLREDGYELVHFSWQDITLTPEAVAMSIRRAFERGVRNSTLARTAAARARRS